jgi:hypothetical protein
VVVPSRENSSAEVDGRKKRGSYGIGRGTPSVTASFLYGWSGEWKGTVGEGTGHEGTSGRRLMASSAGGGCLHGLQVIRELPYAPGEASGESGILRLRFCSGKAGAKSSLRMTVAWLSHHVKIRRRKSTGGKKGGPTALAAGPLPDGVLFYRSESRVEGQRWVGVGHGRATSLSHWEIL